uniref:Uncharacterized protein n=1 Tax=Setaria viridis TaxID=4556 RepID=A0A4U6T865_SETVI|nr:uncharacterized protein LOC117840382 [Setaria viridis]TKV96964.1 hypothetical protein SEVIR_9G464950v2 [Setaria viridis]
MKRRIQPLQQRCHWGYEYTGVNDPSRLSPDELNIDEIMVSLKRMFKNVGEIPTIVREFNAANPPKPEDVSLYFSASPPPGSEDICEAAPRVHMVESTESDDEEEEVLEASSSTSSDAAENFEVKVQPFAKVGSSSESKKRTADEELEAAIPPPPKKKRSIVAKWAVKKSVTAEDVPPASGRRFQYHHCVYSR